MIKGKRKFWDSEEWKNKQYSYDNEKNKMHVTMNI